MRLERTARAKINLGLAVTGRRQDGYHELESVFVRVGLADRLVMTMPRPAMVDDVLVIAGHPDLPVEGNLVLAATRALRDSAGPAGRSLSGLAIALEKRIPVAAGMAGGSSDAAAALALAGQAWQLDVAVAEVHRIALGLGADVPFFVADLDAALVSGVGASVEPLPAIKGGVGFLLMTPLQRLSTANVFSAYDGLPRSGQGARGAVARLADAMRCGLDGEGLTGHAADLAEANDLWPAASVVDPGLPELRARLAALLGRPILLTGSGPTLLALYPSVAAALEAGREVAHEQSDRVSIASMAAVDQVATLASWRFS